MSESKHTPEPWEFGYGQTREFGMCLGIGLNSAPDWHVVAVVSPADSVNHADEANARRIVACVNACAGVDTECLEVAPIGIFASKYGSPGYIDQLEKQRDELLAAMIHIQQVACSGSPELGIAIDAIASVKGEQ